MIGHGFVREGTSAAFRVYQVDGRNWELVLDIKETVFEWAVAFRPDGRQLAVAHRDKSVSVFDLKTKKRIRSLKLGALPSCLAFNPSQGDTRLAVAVGNVVRIFDVDRQIEHKPLRHDGAVTRIWSLSWHPQGKRLVAACTDRLIHLWDADLAAEVTLPWKAPPLAAIGVAFNPAGDRVVSTDYRQTRLWDAATGRLLMTASTNAGMLFSSDGSLLAYGMSGAKVQLYRVAAGHELRLIRRPKATATEIHANPLLDADGRILAATSYGSLNFFHLATGEELASARLPPGIRALPWSFHPASGWLTAGLDRVLHWPARADADQAGLVHVGPPKQLAACRFEGAAASADSRLVAVADGDAGAFVLNLDQPGARLTLKEHHDVRRVALSPNGSWVVTCSHWRHLTYKNARIWDAATGKLVKELPLEDVTFAGFSPDSKWLATFTGRHGGKLWEVGTWRLVRDLGGDVLPAFSPDSKLLALNDVFGTIALVEVATGREVARLTFPEPGWYHPACFSPDGAHLIATHADLKAIYVWDLRLVRQQLKARGLDWEGPDYPAPRKDFARPLRLIVEKDTAP